MGKTSIKIYNIGPIKDIEIVDLKRVNVFIGASASGKSTIAKIISQAIWCEKNFITRGDKLDFKEQLIKFHRFSDTYFSEQSLIEYTSPWTTITFQKSDGIRLRFKTNYTRREQTKSLYNNLKIQYVPAERNFVTSIPNLEKYNEIYDNVFSFLQDWQAYKVQYRDIRTCYKVSDIDEMPLQFRTLRDGTQDYVRVGDTEIDVELLNSSSGIQSILPLLLVSDEVLNQINAKNKPFSYSELKNLERIAPKELMPIIKELNDRSRSVAEDENFKQVTDGLWNAVGYNGAYNRTFLIIEEPEQNIYPVTQRALIYHLLNRLQDSSSLTITTHSPYILYAFDNALVAGKVAKSSKKAGEMLKKEFPKVPALFTAENVDLWQVENGSIISLIDLETGGLGENVFNDQLGYSVDEMADLYSILRENEDGNE